MKTIKHLFLLVCIAGCFAACKKDNTDNFDQEAQFKSDTTAIRNFITENHIPAIKDPNSGIFYQIIEPGTGSITYTPTTQITADYEGRLLDGSVFDTTEGKQPITFSLGGVIPGWQVGIQFIQKGGKIRLLIPSLYGYQNIPKAGIPENSILDFDITLTDVD